jgi:hypothetical protein
VIATLIEHSYLTKNKFENIQQTHTKTNIKGISIPIHGHGMQVDDIT